MRRQQIDFKHHEKHSSLDIFWDCKDIAACVQLGCWNKRSLSSDKYQQQQVCPALYRLARKVINRKNNTDGGISLILTHYTGDFNAPKHEFEELNTWLFFNHLSPCKRPCNKKIRQISGCLEEDLKLKASESLSQLSWSWPATWLSQQGVNYTLTLWSLYCCPHDSKISLPASLKTKGGHALWWQMVAIIVSWHW